MSITVDGERSLQRLWVARKLMRIARALKLPAMAKMIDGFTYRVVNRFPKIDLGRVTAPAGAGVMCMQASGLSMLASDYWLGGMYPAQTVHVSDREFDPNFLITFGSNNATTPHQAVIPHSPDSFTLPVPGLSPLISEFLLEHVNYIPAAPDTTDWWYEVTRDFYLAAGQMPVRFSLGFAVEGWSDARPPSPLVSQPMPGNFFRSGMHSTGYYTHTEGDNERTAFFGIDSEPNTIGVPVVMLEELLPALPAAVRTEILDIANAPTQIGSYVHAMTKDADMSLLHVVNATSISMSGANDKWKLFFVMRDSGGLTTVSSDNFVGFLDTISDEDIVDGVDVDYAAAARMLEKLLPWPNRNFEAASDSAMFHDDDGDVYTWTRLYGSAKFSGTEGLVEATLNMPTVVTAGQGIRPEIYRAGAGLFLCICNKPSRLRTYTLPAEETLQDADWNGVRGIFVGSPFDSWTQIATPPSGYRVLHCRPVRVSLEDSILLGILVTVPESEEQSPSYSFAAYQANEWKLLSPLNVEVDDPDFATWATGLYGDDPLVGEISTCLAQPPILPQMFWRTYTDYT